MRKLLLFVFYLCFHFSNAQEVSAKLIPNGQKLKALVNFSSHLDLKAVQYFTPEKYLVNKYNLTNGISNYPKSFTNRSAIENVLSLPYCKKNIMRTGKTTLEKPVRLQDKNIFALKSPLLNLQLSKDR